MNKNTTNQTETYQTTLSIQDWIDMTDCPIQRDTRRHARYAKKYHLANSSITHRFVSAVKLSTMNMMFKLDGHTRAYLWDSGDLDPSFDDVIVTVYQVDTFDEMKELYTHFDNARAAETSKDKLTGIFKLHKFDPCSDLLRNGGVVSACRYLYAIGNREASRRIDVYKAVTPFIPLLKEMDKQDFKRYKIRPSLFLILILTAIVDGNNAYPFWHDFQDDNFFKDEIGNKSMPFHLHDLVTYYLEKNKLAVVSPTRTSIQAEFLESAFSIYITWKEMKFSGRKPSPRSLSLYFERPEFIKFITQEHQL